MEAGAGPGCCVVYFHTMMVPFPSTPYTCLLAHTLHLDSPRGVGTVSQRMPYI
jgi:hypothetical protein